MAIRIAILNLKFQPSNFSDHRLHKAASRYLKSVIWDLGLPHGINRAGRARSTLLRALDPHGRRPPPAPALPPEKPV